MDDRKVIVVFGGTSGIGKEIVRSLKEQPYKICVSSRTAKFIQEENFESFPCDITKHVDLSAVLSHILVTWGKIDVIINCAGSIILKPLLKYSSKDYHQIFDTNVKGAILVSQNVIPIFQVQKYGRFIHLGSTRSITVAPDKSLYAMSKFALRALSSSINLEFNKEGIYSSLVCPGRIDFEDKHPTQVKPKEIVQVIEKIIELPNNTNIPEIIIGGQI
jgi:NADP-dependent 3-hydroxy acid dehydrogenase YdfG